MGLPLSFLLANGALTLVDKCIVSLYYITDVNIFSHLYFTAGFLASQVISFEI